MSSYRLQAYTGLIRPVLEYASSAWDPSQDYLQKKLENVQKRAARFVTSNYQYDPGSMTAILAELKLEPLKQRRRENRLVLFCKGVQNQAKLPKARLQKAEKQTRHMHSEHFIPIGGNTNAYKFSFIPNSVYDWNEVPQEVFTRMQSAEYPIRTFAAVVRRGANC